MTCHLPGRFDGSDYSLIDNGFNHHGSLAGWFNGDFNYDGVVDGSDYSLIDNAFNRQRTALPSALVASAVGSVIFGHTRPQFAFAPMARSQTTRLDDQTVAQTYDDLLDRLGPDHRKSRSHGSSWVRTPVGS